MADKYNGKYPAAWTDDEVQQYIDTGTEPPKASNGVWVTDITRDAKDLGDWTMAELYALYNGELNTAKSIDSQEFEDAIWIKARLASKDASKWSWDEALHWLVTGKEPEKTPSGNFLNDPERWEKDIQLWNDSELVDFGLGYFGDYERSREYVLIEALTRFGLPAGTTFDDYAVYCAKNIKPALAPHGSLINDRTRLDRDFTDDEVLDWAIGAIDYAHQDESALLSRAITQVGGEWWWSKAEVAKYISDNTIPDAADAILEGRSATWLLKFARETKEVAAADRYVDQVLRENLSADTELDGQRVPTAWTEDHIKQFALEGTVPASWEGIWIIDLTRGGRALSEKEVAAVYYEKIVVDTDQLIAGYNALKAKLDNDDPEKYVDLYVNDALALHFELEEPKRLPDGTLYLSWTRDQVPVEQWDDATLRLLFAGKVVTKLDYDEQEIIESKTGQWAEIADYNQRRDWFIEGVEPEITPNGTFVNDPGRDKRSLRDWTDAELVAMAQGQIVAPKDSSPKAIISLLTERRLIESAEWSMEEAARFFATGRPPEKTAFGNDVIDYDADALNQQTSIAFFADWARGSITLPNAEGQVINAARKLLGANTLSDAEVLTYLKAYKGDGSDRFASMTIHDDLKTGSDDALKRALYHWNLPDSTTVEQALAAYDGFEDGYLTSNDVMRLDGRRDTKAAYQWSLEELTAWARGEITESKTANATTLTAAIRNKVSQVDPRWTDKAVKLFLAKGTKPRLTSNGVLVEDIVRDKTYPSDWADADLKAYALGELVTTQTDVDIKLALRVRFKASSKLTDAQLLRFVATGEQPDLDTPQPFTNPLKATDAQLKAFARGDLHLDAAVVAATLMEMRSRFQIDPHWTDAAILAYYSSNTYPTKTSTDVFVDDRLRDITSCEKWSLKEIIAFARGEIKAPTIALKGEKFLSRARGLLNVERALPADKWSTDEVLAYLRTGERPSALSGNVFVNDPARVKKQAIEWSNAELKAWLAKEIPETVLASAEALWTVVYSRFQLPQPWYHEDARSYVLSGTEVPRLPSGIWIRDRERDQRPAYTWTRAEIKAWARGQILPGLHAPEEDLVDQACLCFSLSPTLSAEFIKQRVASITEDTTPMTVAFVKEDLLSYATGMKTEGAIPAKAALWQQLLNRCIIRVCGLKGQDFVDGWTTLLSFYYDHRTTFFSPGVIYNGVGLMKVSTKGQQHFQNMTTILMNTCDPATRDAAVKRINWKQGLEGCSDDSSRHQILAYYNL